MIDTKKEQDKEPDKQKKINISEINGNICGQVILFFFFSADS